MNETLKKIFCKEVLEENIQLKERVETLQEKAKNHQKNIDDVNRHYKGILKKNNIRHP